MPDTVHAIVALPEDDVAQIKSSVAITSLVDVVHGLVCNSLDAQASKVQIFIDFGRGSCLVEDDGIGIPLSEFAEEGGLAKAYHTSKYQYSGLHGSHGIFLSSVAALAFLTITSRHISSCTTNTLTCHQSRTISRNPALPEDNLTFGNFGTRVIVRNLFGSMPVRIKQRAVQVGNGEVGKEWKDLIRDTVSLLLAWHLPIMVTLKAETANKKLRLGGPNTAQLQSGKNIGKAKRSQTLSRNLNVLTQAGFIEIGSWPSWVPVVATTSTVSIRGAISLDAAPTKQVQFISLGVQPISSEAGDNELYREINSLFSNSRFGVVDDTSTLNQTEQLSRGKDRRVKQNNFTHKQIRGERRGIDRWPMFFLQIECEDDPKLMLNGKLQAEDAVNLRIVLSILSAMITQWLNEHHFRPHRLGSGGNMLLLSDTLSADTVRVNSERAQNVAYGPSTSCSSSKKDVDKSDVDSARSLISECTTTSKSNKRKLSHNRTSCSDHDNSLMQQKDQVTQPQISAFQTWSRIKSGKRDFYDQSSMHLKNNCEFSKSNEKEDSAQFQVSTSNDIVSAPSNLSNKRDALIVPHVSGEANNDDGLDKARSAEHHANSATEISVDEFIPWKDPVTRKAFILNTRSGLLIPDDNPTREPHHNVLTVTDGMQSNPELRKKSVRLETREKQTKREDMHKDWIVGILNDWINPVFQCSESAIPQYSTDLPFPEHNGHQICFHTNSGFAEVSPAISQLQSRLSISGLKTAKVISQVDNKFILIQMSCASRSIASPVVIDTKPSSILVIVDQHAADERCKIEALLDELCTPYPTNMPLLKSSLGYSPQILSIRLQSPIVFQTTFQEAKLLRAQAGFFSRWGILIELNGRSAAKITEHSATNSRITVTALPPGILERCIAEPQHIISILRAEAWSRASNPLSTKSNVPTITSTNTDPTTETNLSEIYTQIPTWHTRLSSCPQGIIDLLNSRACRSAIMFNDVLSKGQCEELVKKLAECVFPWQCAHGRPSIVPLVALSDSLDDDHGGIGRESAGCLDGKSGFRKGLGWSKGKSGDGQAEQVEDGGFMGAFKRWRGSVGEVEKS